MLTTSTGEDGESAGRGRRSDEATLHRRLRRSVRSPFSARPSGLAAADPMSEDEAPVKKDDSAAASARNRR